MPRKKVEAKSVLHNGKRCWRVIIPRELNGGKQGRRYFNDKLDARAHARQLEDQRHGVFGRFLAFTSDIQNATIHALDILKGRESEIAEACKFYVSQNVREEKTVAAAIAECIESKRTAGTRERSRKALANALGRFAKGRESKLVHEIATKEIEDWIKSPGFSRNLRKIVPASPSTRRSRLIDVGTFFSFCVKRGYCQRNPAVAIDRVRLDDKMPEILSFQEVDQLLFFAQLIDPPMARILAISLFAGIRPETARKLRYEDFVDGYIRIVGAKNKTRDTRLIEINETMIAWLKLPAELPLKSFNRRMLPIRAAMVRWPHDCLRRTFVSNSLVIHGAAKTANDAAHSEQMLFNHYRALVTRADAEAFWDLRPTNPNAPEPAARSPEPQAASHARLPRI